MAHADCGWGFWWEWVQLENSLDLRQFFLKESHFSAGTFFEALCTGSHCEDSRPISLAIAKGAR